MNEELSRCLDAFGEQIQIWLAHSDPSPQQVLRATALTELLAAMIDSITVLQQQVTALQKPT